MLLVLAVLCAIAWFFGFVVYHVASFAIHLLLVAAVISLNTFIASMSPTTWPAVTASPSLTNGEALGLGAP